MWAGVVLANATSARATVTATQIANPACPASNAAASRRSLAVPAPESVVGTTASHPNDRLFALLHAPVSRLNCHCVYGVSIPLVLHALEGRSCLLFSSGAEGVDSVVLSVTFLISALT